MKRSISKALLLIGVFLITTNGQEKFDKSYQFLSLSVSSLGPKFGVSYSFPVYYDFLHVDLSGDYSIRPNLKGSQTYFKTSNRFNTNAPITIEKDSIFDMTGADIYFGLTPTIYLKRIVLGFECGYRLAIYKCKEMTYSINPNTKEEILIKNVNNSGSISLDSDIIGGFIGYHYKRLEIRTNVLCENGIFYNGISLKVHIFKRVPNRLPKKCIDYDARKGL